VDHREHIVSTMNVNSGNRFAPSGEVSQAVLTAGLVVLAGYHLGLAAFMTISPHSFYKSVGPFEAFNRHYIRDVATFSAALGFGFVVATRRASWRVPLIAVTTVQFALHTVNHLLDAHAAHPQWTGWFDFLSLLATTVLLAWMWWAATRASPDAGAPRPDSTLPAEARRPSPSPSPLVERSTT
jgi:hypothetical protein